MYLFQAYALNADSTDEPIRLLATLPTGATGDIDNNVDDDILSSFIIVVKTSWRGVDDTALRPLVLYKSTVASPGCQRGAEKRRTVFAGLASVIQLTQVWLSTIIIHLWLYDLWEFA